MGTARYDKYDPISGGFRAPLAAAWDSSLVGELTGVGLDANGRVVAGAGNTGVRGVLVIDHPMVVGSIADVMTSGEIVNVEDLDAGTVYSSDDAGAVSETPGTELGHTVEATRLVVRVQTGA